MTSKFSNFQYFLLLKEAHDAPLMKALQLEVVNTRMPPIAP